MRIGVHRWQRDVLLRIAGLLLIAIGALATKFLFYITGRADHAGSALDFVLAVVGLLSLSMGAGLTWLGAHIHDRIEVSKRWARPESVYLQAVAAQSASRNAPADRVVFDSETR